MGSLGGEVIFLSQIVLPARVFLENKMYTSFLSWFLAKLIMDEAEVHYE